MATILVVDDRYANRAILVTLLSRAGYRVLQAADGNEALAVCRLDHVSLVITDVLMPVMDGFELVRELRRDEATANMPVIFYTAHYSEPEAKALALSSGVSWVLTKPAHHDALLQTVGRALVGETDGGDLPDPAPSTQAKEREHLRLLTDKLAEAVDALRESKARLTVVMTLGFDLAAERDIGRLLQRGTVAARDLFSATYSTLGIVDANHHAVQQFAICGADAAKSIVPRDVPPGFLRTVVAERRTVRGENPSGLPVDLQLPRRHPVIRSYLAAPIASTAEVFGWLCLVENSGASYAAVDEELIAVLGRQVGRLIESLRGDEVIATA